MNLKTKKTKELTGKHVLLMLLAFFGVTLSVNIIFTVAAVKSFSGEDVPRSYRQGLEYNDVIAARETQTDLGWQVCANTAADRILVRFSDADGLPISGLQIDGKLRHPATLSNDQELQFIEISNGVYEARIMGLRGRWDLSAIAIKESDKFRFEHEIWLS